MNLRSRYSWLPVLLLFVFLASSCADPETLFGEFIQWIIESNEITDGVTGVTVYDPERCENGYTLVNALGGHEADGAYNFSVLIDMNGDIANEWALIGFPVKMLPGGYVMGADWYRDDGSGHQEMESLVQLDWFGNEVWRFDQWDQDAHGNPLARNHHDFLREGNPVGYPVPDMEPLALEGNTLILAHQNVDRPDISQWTLEDDVIYEVDWQGNIVWRWLASDHFDEFGFDQAARDAILNQQIPSSPEDDGALLDDWLHINSISTLGPNRWHDGGDERFAPENIVFSCRNANIIGIIGKATGQVVWKIGPSYGPQHAESRLGQVIGPHHAHLIPQGLPGAGNVLVFDNGGFAGYGSFLGLMNMWPNQLRLYSRVLEIDPVALRTVWSYQRILPRAGETYSFFSWYISSAQRLLNGNTLITEGATGRIFEVTPAQELVWEYISPFDDFSVRADSSMGNDVYRAYRIPYDYAMPRSQKEVPDTRNEGEGGQHDA